MSTLDQDTVRHALQRLEGWQLEDQAIVREWRFASFRDAIDFLNEVADLADEADHHPDLWNSYATVRVRLTSHDVGGVSQRDLDLAARIDEVARQAATGT
jgi:4a-hydroxytetrahydrobiopterin dehydratase